MPLIIELQVCHLFCFYFAVKLLLFSNIYIIPSNNLEDFAYKGTTFVTFA